MMLISEAVQLAMVDKIPSLAAAGAAIFSGYFAYRAHDVATKTQAVAQETAKLAEAAVTIAKHTEENTNHLKDELVAAVAKERFAAGEKKATDAAADEAAGRSTLGLGQVQKKED